jgi:ribosomal protein L14
MQSMLDVADNTGAKQVICKSAGGSSELCRIGDVIKVGRAAPLIL